MKLSLFIKNLLKSTLNNRVFLLLELLRNTNYSYIFLITFVISAISWCPFPSVLRSIPHFIPVIQRLPQFIFLLIDSIPVFILVYMVFKRKNVPKHVLTYSNIKGISKISNFLVHYSTFLDHYYTLIPICLSTTGIVLVTLLNISAYFLLVGIFLFFLGIYVFFMFYLSKFTLYNMGTYDKYNNINRANDIFINYILSPENNMRYLAIKEFTKHFERVLDGIDFHFDALFDKKISIDSLQTDENITVKKLIIRYLPLYLNYCSETELNSFKLKMDSMVNLIDKDNMITSLDIIKIVYSVHQDIVTFLSQHFCVVPKDTLLANSIYNTKKIFYIFTKVFVAIFFITGLFKFFIPYEILNKIFETFNENFGNLLDSDFNFIALIPPFLALIPIIYKFLKEINE